MVRIVAASLMVLACFLIVGCMAFRDVPDDFTTPLSSLPSRALLKSGDGERCGKRCRSDRDCRRPRGRANGCPHCTNNGFTRTCTDGNPVGVAFVETIPAAAGVAGNAITDAGKAGLKGVKDLGQKAGEGLAQGATQAANGAKSVSGSVVSGLSEGAKTVGNGVKDVGQQAVSGVSGAANSVADGAKSVVNDIRGAFSSLFG